MKAYDVVCCRSSNIQLLVPLGWLPMSRAGFASGNHVAAREAPASLGTRNRPPPMASAAPAGTSNVARRFWSPRRPRTLRPAGPMAPVGPAGPIGPACPCAPVSPCDPGRREIPSGRSGPAGRWAHRAHFAGGAGRAIRARRAGGAGRTDWPDVALRAGGARGTGGTGGTGRTLGPRGTDRSLRDLGLAGQGHRRDEHVHRLAHPPEGPGHHEPVAAGREVAGQRRDEVRGRVADDIEAPVAELDLGLRAAEPLAVDEEEPGGEIRVHPDDSRADSEWSSRATATWAASSNARAAILLIVNLWRRGRSPFRASARPISSAPKGL